MESQYDAGVRWPHGLQRGHPCPAQGSPHLLTSSGWCLLPVLPAGQPAEGTTCCLEVTAQQEEKQEDAAICPVTVLSEVSGECRPFLVTASPVRQAHP